VADRNDAEQDKVLGRIRKMMALANDAAASEGERDNAMRMVLATLAKHNLTMAEAEAHGQQEEARERGDTLSRDQPWCKHVAHSIAKLYFCRYFFSRTAVKGKVKHNFVGRPANVATAQAMADYVIRSIMSEANREWKKQANPGPWWTAFCKGASVRISERCDELRKAEEAASEKTPGTAVVLASFYQRELAANNAWLERAGLVLTKGKSREKAYGGDGYGAGKAFGDKVSLNRQVGAAPVGSHRRLA
jgi:hypothetical protein